MLSTGYASACKSCLLKKRRHERDNGQLRDQELRRKYGITLGDYNSLALQQRDACAICGTSEKGRARGRKRYWSVDHDHATGAVRGLLCQKCNTILGLCSDDTTVLNAAIHYLNRHKKCAISSKKDITA
jgi:hypothetical protein